MFQKKHTHFILRLLDGLARRPLWQDGMEYGHGTGHGIGAYLNVHEGPAQILWLIGSIWIPWIPPGVKPKGRLFWNLDFREIPRTFQGKSGKVGEI